MQKHSKPDLTPAQQEEYARQLDAETEWLDALVEACGAEHARRILLAEMEAELLGNPQYLN